MDVLYSNNEQKENVGFGGRRGQREGHQKIGANNGPQVCILIEMKTETGGGGY